MSLTKVYKEMYFVQYSSLHYLQLANSFNDGPFVRRVIIGHTITRDSTCHIQVHAGQQMHCISRLRHIR
jgi:hypothetical protein